MPYQGRQPGVGVRNRFLYTATASQTTFSGADDNGRTLAYQDGAYVDVYLNGVMLVPGDRFHGDDEDVGQPDLRSGGLGHR
jgi:hypothetical protein